jgi:hypothetical protein
MTTWTRDELDKIGRADELQIASLRKDGTLRNSVVIWVVRVADELYLRSVNGRSSAWFRGMQDRYEGHIRAGGVDKDVTFIEVDEPNINEEIDSAYRRKYSYYQQGSIISSAPRHERRRSNWCRAQRPHHSSKRDQSIRTEKLGYICKELSYPS